MTRDPYDTPPICHVCGIAGCAGECSIWLPREEAARQARWHGRPAGDGVTDDTAAIQELQDAPLTDVEIERRRWFPRPGTYYEGWRP